MRVKQTIGCWLALCMLILPVFVSFSFASEIEDKRAELNDIQQQMQEMENRKAAAREEAEAASASLNEVMTRLNELQAQSNELQKKSDVLQRSIDENRSKLEESKRKHEARMKIYSKRLREIYMSGQLNYLDVLLGANNFSEFASRMYLLQKIISSDIEMLDNIKKATDEINARQEQLDTEMREIKVTQSELAQKQAKVDEIREQRANILYKAQEKEQESASEYERLLALSENVAAMIRNLETSGYAPQHGQGSSTGFMWPCQGEITSYFGWRTHPVFGTTRYHSGMDIAVDYGTPIHAANDGTVIYSGWLGGYGNAVMIDHGGGIVTLYGHNDSLNVSEGQYVSKGTVIAYAGSTGWSTGPHCHFEVRLHGEVTEPLDYLP